MPSLLIRNGIIIDPASGLDAVGDLLVVDGKIASVGATDERADAEYDATGMIVAPGFIDIHVHLREPGKERAETVATGARAAVAGGFTTIVAMPNTAPPIDNVETLKLVKKLAADADAARVEIAACITEGRAGQHPAPIGELAEAGAIAFTDDGSGVDDSRALWEAMQLAQIVDRPLMSHCEDIALSAEGVIHVGHPSEELNLPGVPSEAESVQVARDLALARLTGARLHIQHVSSATSIELIRSAKRQGVRVTAEATPHHIALSYLDLLDADNPADFKMNPPLRSPEDRAEIIEGLRDGTIDCIATDHAPHTAEEKSRGLEKAPFGVIGLENAFGVIWKTLVETGLLRESELIALLTCKPASIIGSDRGSLRAGADADITIIDPAGEWTIDPARFLSKSRNCPFAGFRARGKAKTVFIHGREFDVSTGCLMETFSQKGGTR